MVVSKTLSDYVEDGRYTIVASSMGAAQGIKHLYPKAVVTHGGAEGIGGKKLLIDSYASQSPGVLAVLPKYKADDIVYERFSSNFIHGKNSMNKEDIKRAETIAMVDKAIDKLTLLKKQIIEEAVTVEDISINNRLRSEQDEAIGSFNLDIDIDYTVSPNPEIK